MHWGEASDANQQTFAPVVSAATSYGQYDAGCSGYYVASKNAPDHEMSCVGTTYNQLGFRVALRQGFYDGKDGFGYQKTYLLHNLGPQAILDTIHLAHSITQPVNRRLYEAVHHVLNDEEDEIDLYVWVVANERDDFFYTKDTGTVYTPDDDLVGVTTGYCEGPGGPTDPTICPNYVNVAGEGP